MAAAKRSVFCLAGQGRTTWHALLALCVLAGPACKRQADRLAQGSAHETAQKSSQVVPPSTTLEAKVTVTDDRHHRIQLKAPAKRIASLSPSNTEILFAVGCGNRIVLRDRASDYPPAVATVPKTDPFQLSPAHIAGFRPDLVLLSHADEGRTEALRRIGLTVATFDPKTMEQLFGNIVSVARLCGAEARAKTLVRNLRRRVDAIAEKTKGRKRPRVYVEIDGSDPARPWTAGPGAFVDQLLALAGAQNIATRLTRPYAPMSAIAIMRADPEVILLAAVGRKSASAADRKKHGAHANSRDKKAHFAQRPGWHNLAAVKHGRVIDTIDASLLSRPGPRLVDGLEALFAALHEPDFKGQDQH